MQLFLADCLRKQGRREAMPCWDSMSVSAVIVPIPNKSASICNHEGLLNLGETLREISVAIRPLVG